MRSKWDTVVCGRSIDDDMFGDDDRSDTSG
jgi:hypothetical protein